MKREILYRQPLWSGWHYWGFIDGEFVSPINLGKDSQQFTGLKDKAEKDIYEGDIIDIHQTVNGQSLFVLQSIFPFVVTYTNGELYQYDMLELLDYARPDTDIEVIGNIHEHSRLLS